MKDKYLKKSIFEVPGGFTTQEEWINNYMIIRNEAITRGVKHPIILASVGTGRAYIFEGKKKPFLNIYFPTPENA
jgi:hypothetical protein